MKLKFTKMQGIANDYIYINCFDQQVENVEELAVRLSRRRFSIGSDGIILILPSKVADCRMEIYNADGSVAMMCGNGVRCVGKYVYERGIAPHDVITVETRSGIKTLYLTVEDGHVTAVRVDMGRPGLKPADLPTTLPETLDVPLTVGDTTYRVTCVSMGNPHCVQFVEDVDALNLEAIGPALEHHEVFPERANIEFVQLINRHEIKMRVWERGSGETWACGTGACASVVACILNGKTERDVLVHLRGGDLKIRWATDDASVEMTGPAEFVFDGTVEI